MFLYVTYRKSLFDIEKSDTICFFDTKTSNRMAYAIGGTNRKCYITESVANF